MFVRTKTFKNKDGSTRTYLQLVTTERVNGKVRQRVVANLGRLEHLQKDTLDRLIQSLARFSKSEWIRREALKLSAQRARSWGPALVFYKLWQDLGLEKIIGELVDNSSLKFDVNEALFAMVLNRLCDPSSKLMMTHWMKTVYRPGWEKLSLYHFYRALDFVALHKKVIEQALFSKVKDLFHLKLDLVLWDATTTYFEGEAARGFAEYGFSKDRRPDRLQIMIGVLTTGDGFPIGHEVFPGNMSEVKSFRRALQKVREEFGLGRVIMVADRGMVSREVLGEIEAEGLEYIVGVKLRRVKVGREVLGRGGRFREVGENLKVKEVWHGGKRYIVCFNPEEAERDKAIREKVLEELKAKLSHGGTKALIRNRIYRRYLKIGKSAVEIDGERIKGEEIYDGKYVLLTNSDLSAEEVALAYKGLWRVERAFRELKSTLELRPVYHWKERRIRGHVMICFLAFLLEAALLRKLSENGEEVGFGELMVDLGELRAVEIEVGGRRYLARTELEGKAYAAFKAVGLRPPGRVVEVKTQEKGGEV